MTLSHFTVRTATLVGVRAEPVDVEVSIGPGLPAFAIVGLADLAVLEARERVRSALRASGYELPNARIVVNLAPGPLRKHGTGFDLPIALGILVATKQLHASIVKQVLAVGELSLDGTLRRVAGLLAHGITARDCGLDLLGPPGALAAQAIPELTYRPLAHLSRLRQGAPDACEQSQAEVAGSGQSHGDFAEVVGQEAAVRALCVAAAGSHNILLVGPPGTGKTMLARRLPGILPPLSELERLETALVHSVSGIAEQQALAGVRPFRAPHHSASVAGLVGGGSPPRAGEASLAHNGVLFLDEMPEFGPAALQCLRQPMEDGLVTLVRAHGRLSFPAKFALVGAANPCPCGFLGDPVKPCRCAPALVERYATRIGGPLMDRIDLVVQVGRPDPCRLIDGRSGQSSHSLLTQVMDARDFAAARGIPPSSTLSGAELLGVCRLSSRSTGFLEMAARNQHLSGRGITRLLRVARTLADLDGRDAVGDDHLSEALAYRVRAPL